MKITKIKWFLVAFLILGTSVFAVIKIAPGFLNELAPKKIGVDLAPDFSLRDVSGSEVKLSDLRGKNVILNFWTSWNSISVEQLKFLDDYYKSADKNNLAVIAINNQEGIDTINEFNIYKSGFKNLSDEDGEVGELYDIGVLPLTVFINKAGIEISRKVGPLTVDGIAEKAREL